MKKWYLKWWIWSIAVIATLIIPFIINEAYKMDAGYVTLWEAKDVLAFYGAFLSFVGTVVLGVVAMYQSWKANCLSERLLKLEEEKDIPIVDILEIIEEPEGLSNDTYRNSLSITIDEAFFNFKEDNTILTCYEPILVFKLKNICSNHIISIHLKAVKQSVLFENGKQIDKPIRHFSWNGGIRVLDRNEAQFLLISGVSFEYPKGLAEDDVVKLGYTSPMIELVLMFELKNIKGKKYVETIKVCCPFCFLDIDKLNFPCIFEKEIESILPENE